MTDVDASADDTPSNTMRRRGDESRLKLWILLEANRWVVAGGTVIVFFLGTVLAASLLPNRVLVASGDPVETLFQALVTATITGVTLVVSINSLVLSQELGVLGDQRERIEGSMSFREDVEAALGIEVAPSTPAAFLAELVGAIETRSERLSAAADAADPADVHDRVSEYAADLQTHASSVSDELSGRQFGTFDVLSAALNFNYSWKIYEARRLRAEIGDGSGSAEGSGTEPTTEMRETLDSMVEILTLFGAAREHFKTLYFQWELVDLSRAMLYSAVPATIVATVALLFHAAFASYSGVTLGITHYVWIVALGGAIALAPFAILLAFVLRIGTVAKRTLSIGPFVLRTTDDGARTPGEE